jgi:DNA-directed RNA polymerase specialized sigma subunit
LQIEKYMPMAVSIAVKVKKKVPSMELDDLVAESYLQLYLSQSSFDSNRGCQFQTFAYTYIYCRLLNYCRKQIKISMPFDIGVIDTKELDIETMIDINDAVELGYTGVELKRYLEKGGTYV